MRLHDQIRQGRGGAQQHHTIAFLALPQREIVKLHVLEVAFQNPGLAQPARAVGAAVLERDTGGERGFQNGVPAIDVEDAIARTHCHSAGHFLSRSAG